MKNLSRYLRICIKRIAKAFPGIFAVSLVMFISIFMIAALVLKSYSGTKKMQIGVVDNSKESQMSMGLLALEKIDNVKFSISFLKMDEETAKTSLEKDEIVGYVVIPETYMHDIYYGNNTPAVYVTKRSSAGFNTAIASELTDTVSEIVTTSQSFSYSVLDISTELRRNSRADSEKIDTVLLEHILKRDDIFSEKVLGIADSVSTAGYYICGMLTLFVFLLGIAFCKVLYKKDYAIYRVLKCNRIGSFKQVLSEYFSFMLFVFIIIAIFTFAEFKALGTIDKLEIPELEYFDRGLTIKFVLQMIPPIMAISAFQLMLYESATGVISSVILQFVITTLFGYLSGLFYPSYFFPELAAKIGKVLPSGVAFSYIRKCIAFENSGMDIIPLFLYAAVFLSAATTIRECRIRRNSI